MAEESLDTHETKNILNLSISVVTSKSKGKIVAKKVATLARKIRKMSLADWAENCRQVRLEGY